MAFKVKRYKGDSCDRCTAPEAMVHLSITSRDRYERQFIDLCDKCWEFVMKKSLGQRVDAAQASAKITVDLGVDAGATRA